MASETRTIVKEVKDTTGRVVGRLYSDDTILLKHVRASYPHVGTPYKHDDSSTPGFGIVALMPKNTHVGVKNLCKEIADKLMKENKVAALPADKKFFKDGDLAAKEGYDGCYAVSAREVAAKPPMVRDATGNKVTPEKADALIYGGCYVNVLIRPWFQKSDKWGKRVNANLLAVQFVRNGEPFGEGTRISEDDVDETFDNEEEGSSAAADDIDDL